MELLRPDPNTGKVHTLLTVEVFGIIRSLMAFRLTGGTKDYIVVGSDSGRIVILEYQPSKNLFEKIHQETFGKSGCRRIVPGQYLAVDPKGRAVMISKLYANGNWGKWLKEIYYKCGWVMHAISVWCPYLCYCAYGMFGNDLTLSCMFYEFMVYALACCLASAGCGLFCKASII